MRKAQNESGHHVWLSIVTEEKTGGNLVFYAQSTIKDWWIPNKTFKMKKRKKKLAVIDIENDQLLSKMRQITFL